MKAEAIAVVWYKREHWDELMALFEDSHLLPDSFEEWLEKVNGVVSARERSGFKVYKIDLEPGPFAKWCRLNALDINGYARARYVNEIAARLYADPER